MEPVVVGGSGELAAPERNKFFYGKLMDVAQFEKEQQYFLRQQWLMNRLTIGSGVLCGLAVVPRGRWHALIEPGVAIDALGRPIVVSHRITVDLRQRTDDKGDPIGDPVSEGEVLLSLAYAETSADPVATVVTHCDTPGNCAPSTIREEFRLLVRAAPPPPPVADIPADPGELHEMLISLMAAAPCTVTPDDLSVPLARIGFGAEEGDIAIDVLRDRRLVYSNQLLFQLILCLIERVQ